jgi:RNA polymerase sigma-70 factor (ECF subfamily)
MADEERFLQLVREHQRIIHRLVGLYAQDRDERKDLEQETLLQAWKGWPTYRGDAKFSTWLYRICLNTILTQKRRPKVVQRREGLEELPRTGHDPAIRNDESERLQLAMRQLPETDRALLSMHLEGFDHTEIADVIGITANHVGVKLHRIKTRLTELLQPH